MDKNTINYMSPEWQRARFFKIRFGLGPAQMQRYAEAGFIRTSAIRRPGQTRGIRLYHVGDVKALIRKGVEEA